MMPTPVKSPSPLAAAAPARTPVPAAAESSSGDTFQQELVRRRRGERADDPAARKAEPKRETKRETKLKKPARPGGRESAAAVEEPEIRQSSGPEDRGTATSPVDDGTEPAPAADHQPHAEGDPAPGEEGEPGGNDAAALFVAAAAVPATEQVLIEVAPDAADSGDVAILSKALSRDAALPSVVGSPDANGYEGQGAAIDGASESDLGSEVSTLFPEDDLGAGEAGAETADQDRDGSGAYPRGPIGLPDDVPEVADAAATQPFEPPASFAEMDAVPAAEVGSFAAAVSDLRADARVAAPTGAGPAPLPALPPESRFAADNHESIVTSMRGELLPNGGSMRIRLDPPQLGALQVTVRMEDGLVTAAFETSNDEATRLLGHSLNQLKSVLESHGVAVDKLHVQQAPREAQTPQPHDDGRREQGSQSQEQEQSARQEQQRREMLRKLWQRLTGGQDPLDLTA